MKPIPTNLLHILLSLLACGQIPARDSLKTYPGFQLMRSGEDCRFLQKHLPADNPWETIKYLPLSKNSFVSFGGDVRSELQMLQNEEWKKGNDDAALFQRFMFHSDWYLGKNK